MSEEPKDNDDEAIIQNTISIRERISIEQIKKAKDWYESYRDRYTSYLVKEESEFLNELMILCEQRNRKIIKTNPEWALKYTVSPIIVWDNHHIVRMSLQRRFPEYSISLPESIGNLSKLETLNLSYNRFTCLPDSIGNLSSLKEIDLRNNELTSLPESIGNLKKLELLIIYDNKLSSLPESIGNLTNLKDLLVIDNHLTTLPESIGNLSNLIRLYLRNNQLSSIPESIGNLSSLRELHFSNNHLTTLPESIGNLTNLRELSIGDNRLSTLPKSFDKIFHSLRLFEHLGSGIEIEYKVENFKCDSCGGTINGHFYDHGCATCGITLCEDCSTKCYTCEVTYCSEHINRCESCGEADSLCDGDNDDYFLNCDTCGISLCDKCVYTCKDCNKPFCEVDFFNETRSCFVCEKYLCKEHLFICDKCGESFCYDHVADKQNTCTECRSRYMQEIILPSLINNLTKEEYSTFTQFYSKLNQKIGSKDQNNEPIPLILVPLHHFKMKEKHITELLLKDFLLEDLPTSVSQFDELEILEIRIDNSSFPTNSEILVDIPKITLFVDEHLPSWGSRYPNLLFTSPRWRNKTLVFQEAEIIHGNKSFIDLNIEDNHVQGITVNKEVESASILNLRKFSYLKTLFCHQFEELMKPFLEEVIPDLICIEFLHLKSWKFEVNTSFFSHLPKLRHLEIIQCPIPPLPSSINHLTNLEQLTIKTSSSVILPHTFGDLYNLTKLIIHSRGSFTFPQSFSKLSQLEHLEIKGCQLEEYPDWIGDLKNLIFLDIPTQGVEMLPESIANLTRLQTMKIGLLTRLPSSMDSMVGLVIDSDTYKYYTGNLKIPSKNYTTTIAPNARLLIDSIIDSSPGIGDLEKYRKRHRNRKTKPILFAGGLLKFLAIQLKPLVHALANPYTHFFRLKVLAILDYLDSNLMTQLTWVIGNQLTDNFHKQYLSSGKRRDRRAFFFKYIHIDCESISTAKAIIEEILQQLSPITFSPISSLSEGFETLTNTLEEKNLIVLLTLNEVDSIKGANDFINSLLIAVNNFEKSHERVGRLNLIFITHEKNFFAELQSRAKSSYGKSTEIIRYKNHENKDDDWHDISFAFL